MRRSMLTPFVAVLLTLAPGGAADAQSLACSSPQKPQQVVDLLFGRKIGGRIGVTEAQWAKFVDREITPRFPDGLTVFNAYGQWRDAEHNRIVR